MHFKHDLLKSTCLLLTQQFHLDVPTLTYSDMIDWKHHFIGELGISANAVPH